jgi:hypothetical protein
MDRRACARFGCDHKSICQPVAARGPNELQWSARVHDLSAGGVGLLLPRRFERGTVLAVELQTSTASPSRLLLARVMHATARAGRGWLVGCAWVRGLTADQLREVLGDAHPAAAASDGAPRPG